MSVDLLENVYKRCEKHLDINIWEKIKNEFGSKRHIQDFPEFLDDNKNNFHLPQYLPDLARLELARHLVTSNTDTFPAEADLITINPALELVHTQWQLSPDSGFPQKPKHAESMILIWRDKSGAIHTAEASAEELLILKMISSNISIEETARQAGISETLLRRGIRDAENKGLLITPRPRIRRHIRPDIYQTASTFTLQWHITHTCDLHCKHCYDRSKRSDVSLEQARKILDDFKIFCERKHVRGHVCFTGGNPFMHPSFMEIYRMTAEEGFSTSILANPVSREQLQELARIQKPGYFQVSLEGLEEHNDYIRGKNHFHRTLAFLHMLKEEGISSAVMLTLTKDNVSQVLPLAELLRQHAEYLTYNRLSPVGEGAKLASLTKEEYEDFVKEYCKAAEDNPILGYKDNLINIELENSGKQLFGGCTGYGCGAAFNFVTVLPDGEVHACRKFPSLIGNIYKDSLIDIYDSPDAARYRQGTSACLECSLRKTCGGCMAVSYGHSPDIFSQRDPHCFIGK